MEFEGSSVSSTTIEELYNENKMLGTSLHDSVSKFEQNKIQQLTKRNRSQAKLNLKFQEISRIKNKSEQVAVELNKLKSEKEKELLKREDVEQKNEVNERAFNTQLEFQTAVSNKLDQLLEEINGAILSNGRNMNLLEKTWEAMKRTVDKFKNDQAYLQSKIDELDYKSRCEQLKLNEDLDVGFQNIVNLKNILENLTDKCIEIKNRINKLPLEEYKMRIEEGTGNVLNIQKKLCDTESDILQKIGEIKRKKDKEEFELKHLIEELSNTSEQFTKLCLERQNFLALIDEMKQEIDELTIQNNEHIHNLKSIANTKAIKDKEEQLLHTDVEKFSCTDLKNDNLKNNIETLAAEIVESTLKLNEEVTCEKEMREKEENLLDELYLMSEKLKCLKEENNNLEKNIEVLQADADSAAFSQNDWEKCVVEEIDGLQSTVNNLEENLKQLKIKNNGIINDIVKYKEQFEELKVTMDEHMKEEDKARQKVMELRQKLESCEIDNKNKLHIKKEHLEGIVRVADGCDQIIQGDLFYVPDEYERLQAEKDAMFNKFKDKKDDMVKNHTELLKKLDSELSYMESANDESLGIEIRRGDTIRAEIKAQNIKNDDLEGRCQQYENKIKSQEHNIELMKNRIVVRENRLARASNEAVVTRKEILDCIKETELIK